MPVDYNDFAETFSKSREHLIWDDIIDIIMTIQKNKGTSVLDIGCGNGRFLLHAKACGYRPQRYLGIDASSQMIQEAKRQYPEECFRIMPMEELSCKEDSAFDTLLFLASFHHLDSKEARLTTMKQAKNTCTPGGYIYLLNWNLLEQERYHAYQNTPGEFSIKISKFSRYYHGFSLHELAALATDAGLHICTNSVVASGKNIVTILQKYPF